MLRLTETQIAHIKRVFGQCFLPQDRLWLFGSRVKTDAKGGDIDLYVETHYTEASKVVDAKLRFLSQLQMAIGEQKIDMVIKYRDYDMPIYHIAQQEGIRLV